MSNVKNVIGLWWYFILSKYSKKVTKIFTQKSTYSIVNGNYICLDDDAKLNRV